MEFVAPPTWELEPKVFEVDADECSDPCWTSWNRLRAFLDITKSACGSSWKLSASKLSRAKRKNGHFNWALEPLYLSCYSTVSYTHWTLQYVPFLALRRLDARSSVLRWEAILWDLLPPTPPALLIFNCCFKRWLNI